MDIMKEFEKVQKSYDVEALTAFFPVVDAWDQYNSLTHSSPPYIDNTELMLEWLRSEIAELGGPRPVSTREKKARSLNRRLRNFSEISLSVGGYSGPNESTVVRPSEDREHVILTYNYSSYSDEWMDAPTVTTMPTKSFLRRFHAYQVGAWDSYYSNDLIMDGTSWGLTVMLEGEDTPAFEACGSNSFPESYGRLCRLLGIRSPY